MESNKGIFFQMNDSPVLGLRQNLSQFLLSGHSQRLSLEQ